MVAGSEKDRWRLSKTRESHRAMGKEWFRRKGLVSLQSVVCNGQETAVCHKWHVRWCERGRKPPTRLLHAEAYQ